MLIVLTKVENSRKLSEVHSRAFLHCLIFLLHSSLSGAVHARSLEECVCGYSRRQRVGHIHTVGGGVSWLAVPYL